MCKNFVWYVETLQRVRSLLLEDHNLSIKNCIEGTSHKNKNNREKNEPRLTALKVADEKFLNAEFS